METKRESQVALASCLIERAHSASADNKNSVAYVLFRSAHVLGGSSTAQILAADMLIQDGQIDAGRWEYEAILESATLGDTEWEEAIRCKLERLLTSQSKWPTELDCNCFLLQNLASLVLRTPIMRT